MVQQVRDSYLEPGISREPAWPIKIPFAAVAIGSRVVMGLGSGGDSSVLTGLFQLPDSEGLLVTAHFPRFCDTLFPYPPANHPFAKQP